VNSLFRSLCLQSSSSSGGGDDGLLCQGCRVAVGFVEEGWLDINRVSHNDGGCW
jgi:hypothetical protein